MNINITLIFQIIVFIAFIWITKRYIWPPIMNALEQRRETIADGLAAAEKGQKDLELAAIKSREQLAEAKLNASRIVESAHQRANHIIEEAKSKARHEGERLIKLAQEEIEQQHIESRQQLLKEVSGIAVAGAERILQKEIDKASNDRLVKDLVSEI